MCAEEISGQMEALARLSSDFPKTFRTSFAKFGFWARPAWPAGLLWS